MSNNLDLKLYMQPNRIEAGCDEAGRGCLAGPVFAAAVILPDTFRCDELNDSKKLSSKKRYELRSIIEKEALSFAVSKCSEAEIDNLNILWASVYAMHKALDKLSIIPEYILIDGNRFRDYKSIGHSCIVGGDAKYLSIAAASVLAKTYRDDYMDNIHLKYPDYNWCKNKGYPTREHRVAISKFGITEYHRKSFRLEEKQLNLFL